MAQRSGLAPMRQLPNSQRPIAPRVNSTPLSSALLHILSGPTRSTDALDKISSERGTRTLKRTRRIVSDPPPTPPAHSRPTSAVVNLSNDPDNVLELLAMESSPTVLQPRTPPSHELPTPDITPPSLRSQLSMLKRPQRIERDISLTSVTASFITAPEYVSSDDAGEDEVIAIDPFRCPENSPPIRFMPHVSSISHTITQHKSTSTQASTSAESDISDGMMPHMRGLPKSRLSHMSRNMNARKRYTEDAHNLDENRQMVQEFLLTPVNTKPVTIGHTKFVQSPEKVDDHNFHMQDQDTLARSLSGTLDATTRMHDKRSMMEDLKRLSSVRKSRHTIEAIIVELQPQPQPQPQPQRQLRHTKKNSRLRDETCDDQEVRRSISSKIMLPHLSHRRKSHDLRRHSLGMTAHSSISSAHSNNSSEPQNFRDKSPLIADNPGSHQRLNSLEGIPSRESMERLPSLQMANINHGYSRSHNIICPPSLTIIPSTPVSYENRHQEEASSLSDVVRIVSARSIPSRYSSKSRNDIIQSGSENRNDIHDIDSSSTSLDVPLADESKLHPFWRPARFWDDLIEGYEGADLHEINGVESNSFVPQRRFSFRRTFAILPIRDNSIHRHDSHTKVIQRSHSGKSSTTRYKSSVESIESLRHRKAHQQARTRSLSLWDRWHGLGRRLSEGRRRQRAKQLKNIIGVPIVANQQKTGLAPAETRYKVR